MRHTEITQQKETIGITGGIGCGKSVVSRVLRCNGFVVYDCDANAKLIMRNDNSVVKDLKREIGEEVYLENGEINKSFLSKVLFSDISVRQKVNGIVHSAVKRNIDAERRRLPGLFFIETAIIYESGIDKICNKLWIVESPLEERIKRVMLRDSLTREDIKKRIESQKKELSSLDRSKCTFIENDNSHPMLLLILKMTNKYINHQTFILTC